MKSRAQRFTRLSALVAIPALVLGFGGAESAASASADAAGAAVPQGHGPGYRQAAELTASSGSGEFFGDAVSISKKGSLAVVGAEQASGGGAAYVFSKSGGTWTQTATLVGSDEAPGDDFGGSVSMSANGETVVVGASLHATQTGAAYVFGYSGGTWTQTAELTGSDSQASDMFGGSVAISGAGREVVVGAGGHDSLAGAAYVFADSDGTWSQSAELAAPDGAAGDLFGDAVAVSRNGSVAAVTAPGNGSGEAYLFTRQSDGSWQQGSEVTGSGSAPGDNYGIQASLSRNGSTLLVGADGQSGSAGAFQGAAYVYTEQDGAWSQAAELTASDAAANEYFGRAVAISSSGSTVLVGATGWGAAVGAAYVFTGAGGGWTQAAELQASDGSAYSAFGSACALAKRGSMALIGAFGHDATNGAAYVFKG